MKKISYFLICLTIFFAQNLKIGLKTGLNLSNSIQNEKTYTEPENKISGSFGAIVSYRISESHTVTTFFTTDLISFSHYVNDPKDTKHTLVTNYNYFTITPRFDYIQENKLNISFGPYFSFNLSSDYQKIAQRTNTIDGKEVKEYFVETANLDDGANMMPKTKSFVYGLSIAISYPIEVSNFTVIAGFDYNHAFSDAYAKPNKYTGNIKDQFKSRLKSVQFNISVLFDL